MTIKNTSMTIYLDESGDLGLSLDKKGTPRFFIITLLVCQTKEAIEQIRQAVKRTLKNKLNSKKNNHSELKGTHLTLEIKKYFYRNITQSEDWQIYALVLDKHQLKNYLEYTPTEHRLYNYLSKEILTNVCFDGLNGSLLLTVDKRKGKKGINEFNKYLSTHLEGLLPLNVVYDISHEHSFQNYGLQAVDLFSWGIYRFFEHKENDWFSIYEDKVKLIHIDRASIKKDSP